MQDPEKLRILSIFQKVCDPEIPVLIITDLGIIRDININGEETEVIITPTYTGCPTMDMIAMNIKLALAEHGYKKVKVSSVLSPARTTDWMTEEGKRKLMEYGIAPPVSLSERNGQIRAIECPQCHSQNTWIISEFGSTVCK